MDYKKITALQVAYAAPIAEDEIVCVKIKDIGEEEGILESVNHNSITVITEEGTELEIEFNEIISIR